MRNPVVGSLVWLIRGYQRYISPGRDYGESIIDAIENAANILCVDCTAKSVGRSGMESGTSIAKRPR